MQIEEIELNLKKLLIPVLGLDNLEELQPGSSLINDLGAESIDFVEIIYEIERTYGIEIQANELVTGGGIVKQEDIFKDDVLTGKGAKILSTYFPGSEDRFVEGISKFEMYALITIGDLARIIYHKMKKGKKDVGK